MRKEYWRRTNYIKSKRENKRHFGHCNWYADFVKLYNYWNGFIKAI